jgi:hypothetical protein
MGEIKTLASENNLIDIDAFLKKKRDDECNKYWYSVRDIGEYVIKHACKVCPEVYHNNRDFRNYVCPFKSLLTFCPKI